MRALVPTVGLGLALLVGLAQAEGRQPGQALARYRAGLRALESKQDERAIRELREAVRLDPLLGPAYYDLGRVLMALRRYPEAVQALVGARDAFLQADALASERSAQAELKSKVTLLDDVDYHELDHNRRFPLQYVFEPGRTRALDIPKDRHAGHAEPVPAAVFAALGAAHHRMGALAEAERAYREALAVDPRLGEVHNNLAVVCLQTNRPTEAEREVSLAERAGFKVDPRLKQEISALKAR